MSAIATRRAVLAGASAALVPLTVSGSSACSFPDLAAELATVRRRYIDEHETCRAHRERQDAYATAKTGISQVEARSDQRNAHNDRTEDGPKWTAWWSAWEEYEKIEPDHDPNGARWAEIAKALNPVCWAVLGQSPRSVHDLALQVQAFALLNACNYIEGDDACDWEGTFELADAVSNFCGVEPIPGLQYPDREARS